MVYIRNTYHIHYHLKKELNCRVGIQTGIRCTHANGEKTLSFLDLFSQKEIDCMMDICKMKWLEDGEIVFPF